MPWQPVRPRTKKAGDSSLKSRSSNAFESVGGRSSIPRLPPRESLRVGGAPRVEEMQPRVVSRFVANNLFSASREVRAVEPEPSPPRSSIARRERSSDCLEK